VYIYIQIYYIYIDINQLNNFYIQFSRIKSCYIPTYIRWRIYLRRIQGATVYWSKRSTPMPRQSVLGIEVSPFFGKSNSVREPIDHWFIGDFARISIYILYVYIYNNWGIYPLHIICSMPGMHLRVYDIIQTYLPNLQFGHDGTFVLATIGIYRLNYTMTVWNTIRLRSKWMHTWFPGTLSI
jgi:hypothetical protein